MTGWVVDGGDLKGWRAEGGYLVADVNRGGKSWLLTERDYTDAILRFEFPLTAATNSGVTFRAKPGVKHMEIQLLDDAHPSYNNTPAIALTGSLWNLALDQRAKLKPVGSWNEMELEVRGRSLHVAVNGRDTLRTNLDQFAGKAEAVPSLQNATGRIGFQNWGGLVRFRKIEVKELK